MSKKIESKTTKEDTKMIVKGILKKKAKNIILTSNIYSVFYLYCIFIIEAFIPDEIKRIVQMIKIVLGRIEMMQLKKDTIGQNIPIEIKRYLVAKGQIFGEGMISLIEDLMVTMTDGTIVNHVVIGFRWITNETVSTIRELQDIIVNVIIREPPINGRFLFSFFFKFANSR